MNRLALVGMTAALRCRLPRPWRKRRCASASPRTPTCSIRRWRAPTSAASCSRRSATSCSTSTTSSTSCRSWRCRTQTSEDGKKVTIKLRQGVKFHDGEAMDAEAVKASLERHMTMQGSFRKPELAAVDKVEVADASTVRLLLKNPFSPLIAQLADRAGMVAEPQGGEGGRRQVRPQARVRRPLQVPRARAAGPHRRREVRRLLERGQRAYRSHPVPTDRGVRRCAWPTSSPAASSSSSARSPPTFRRSSPIPSSSSPPRSRSATRASPSIWPTARPARTAPSARTRACARRWRPPSTARRFPTWSSAARCCRAISGSARRAPTTSSNSRCPAGTWPRPRSYWPTPAWRRLSPST